VFEPGTTHLKCPYCGTVNEIEAPSEAVEEQDFVSQVRELAESAPVQETVTVRCGTCGAESDFTHDVAADRCPFCGSAIVATASSRKLIKPKSLLPFYVTHAQAGESFQRWVASLWFAPNDLVKTAERSGIDGAYIPAWTYDSDTDSTYTGQRGDDYWETQTYTALENGRSVTRTRQVQRTRWRPASGRVFNRFDDVLVLASHSLPPKHAAALEPWDLKSLVPYRDEFLSGFVCETYQVNLDEGFGQARQVMDGVIRQSVARDIGGDHQRIHSVDTRYNAVTFKHILLPVWISAYRYQNRVFRFLVNARTGEVQGERPYSAVKIVLAVLTALAVAAAMFILFGRR
jgi:predicted RNA-binding Zn-ribbon protein involved in translation (DUF1610 family)